MPVFFFAGSFQVIYSIHVVCQSASCMLSPYVALAKPSDLICKDIGRIINHERMSRSDQVANRGAPRYRSARGDSGVAGVLETGIVN
jgi:hypothetical protein